MPRLVVEDLSRDFAGIKAVDGVSFTAETGAITGLIGPNGAGKTTVLNMVSGVVPPSRGRISFEGGAISGLSPARIANRGIRRTFQTVHLFPGLTVLENMVIGRFSSHRGPGWLRVLLPQAVSERSAHAEAGTLLESFDLSRHAHQIAGDLPYGTQRRVEIARALAGRPRLVLLDEPAAGMNEQETEHLSHDIRRIRDGGVTVLLVEHDMSLVMSVCDRITVLDFGRKIADGTPDEIRRDPQVITSYLGAT